MPSSVFRCISVFQVYFGVYTDPVCEVELEVNVEMSFSAFIIIIMITTN